LCPHYHKMKGQILLALRTIRRTNYSYYEETGTLQLLLDCPFPTTRLRVRNSGSPAPVVRQQEWQRNENRRIGQARSPEG
jgi:hypothetical protein